jgi:hypothetical protein
MLERAQVQGAKDSSVHWAGAFASCGGRGATASSTIVYEIAPGNHLGWHTDATEETQYILAGSGELRCFGQGRLPPDALHGLVPCHPRDDGAVGRGRGFVLQRFADACPSFR